MNKNKLYGDHTEAHLDHQLCIQKVVGNGVTHIGLFCQTCKKNNWITWLTKQEVKFYKKRFKLKQIPTRKAKDK
jgi:hypothetical protein